MNMHNYETQIIGTFLNNNSLEFIDTLTEDHFYSCRRTFKAIKSAMSKKIKINYMDIAKESGNEYKAAELHSMMIMALPSMFESYITLIKKVRAEQLYEKILNTAPRGDVEKNVADMMTSLQALDLYKDSQCQELNEYFGPFTEQLEEWEKHKDNQMLIGIPKLDSIIGGLHKGELTVVGARTSVGKSHFALQTAINVAHKNYKVLFISVEMSGEQIYQRAAIRYSGVSSDKMRAGLLDRDDWGKIYDAATMIEKVSFPVTMKLKTIQEIRNRIIFDRPALLIIDYVGRIHDTSANWGGNTRNEIGSITGKLKEMALEFNMAVMMTAQVGRQAGQGLVKITDLRDTGKLEEDSDNAILLSRLSREDALDVSFCSGAEYDKLISEGLIPTRMDIAKQRNGIQGVSVKAVLDRHRLYFKQLEDS